MSSLMVKNILALLNLSTAQLSGLDALATAELAALDGVTAGTVFASKALIVDSNKDLTSLRNLTATNLKAGKDAVAGTLTIFPTTTAKGSLVLSVSDQTGDTVVTLNTAAMGQTTTITLPDPGSSSDTIVLANKTQTLVGKTLTAPTINDPIIPMVVRCSSQLDKTDTTLTDITGLVVTVVPGTYRFRYFLSTTCGGTGGTKTAFKYTTTVVSAINYTSFGMTASAVAAATGTTTTDQATHIASNTAAIAIEVEGTMVVGTGGTVKLQFAENSANSTSSVLVGSWMEFTRIA